MIKNNNLSIAYLSPGWPLNAYPNGIVAYIQNIISGFDDDVIKSIITRHVEGKDHESVIDLSLIEDVNFISNMIDKVLFRIKMPYTQHKAYHRKWNSVSEKIISAVLSQEIKPDLIEVEESFGLAKYLTRSTNIPIVTRLHGPWFLHGPIMLLSHKDDYKVRILNEGQAIRLSHGITSPSLDVLEKTREYYNITLPDAKVIPNPVPPVIKSKQWCFSPSKKQTILMVGRFDLHKGGDLALDAFRIIAKQNKEVEFLFVGPDRGVVIEGKVYSFNEYLDSFIPEVKIKKRIQFLGHCDTKKIMTLRQSSSLTMIPSRYDNFPMTLLEAIATGSPVVGTAVGGIKEIIIHGYNGLLAEPLSAESIAENVLRLLDDSQYMRALSNNAIEDSLKRFSPEVVAKQSIDFYRSVIAKKS